MCVHNFLGDADILRNFSLFLTEIFRFVPNGISPNSLQEIRIIFVSIDKMAKNNLTYSHFKNNLRLLH